MVPSMKEIHHGGMHDVIDQLDFILKLGAHYTSSLTPLMLSFLEKAKIGEMQYVLWG